MNNDAYHFWRKNVRPGTSFGPFHRAPTLWMRLYDWFASRLGPEVPVKEGE